MRGRTREKYQEVYTEKKAMDLIRNPKVNTKGCKC